MDFSKDYMNMCKSEDIQKLQPWEQEVFDEIHNNGVLRGNCALFFRIIGEPVVWLPRQDDLESIWVKNTKSINKEPPIFIARLKSFIESTRFKINWEDIPFKTMEQWMMGMIMDEVFDKKWDNHNKCWVDIFKNKKKKSTT
jgi:hypothetical protein